MEQSEGMDERWKVASPTRAAPWWKTAGKDSWWYKSELPGLGFRYEDDPNFWIGLAMLQKSFDGGPPFRSCQWEGNLIVPAKDLIETITKVLQTRLVRITDGSNGNGQFMFVSDDAMLNLRLSEKGGWAFVKVGTISEEIIKKASVLFDRCIEPDDPKKGLVFALVKTMNGYGISRLGIAGTPLERQNYSPDVISAYDHIVEDLKTESPCGRLIILSGTPGTGKTYLVRSLLAEVTNAAWILVPPHLMSELGSPEILPALTSAKNEFSGPIILIIEDADQCLVQRNDGDMSDISSMLNLGDGILGSILDIRILATTNAKELEMDAATRRPGRLCRYIQVGALSQDLAAKALQRLTGKPVPNEKSLTLAEVYSQARALGWKPPPKVAEKPNLRREIL